MKIYYEYNDSGDVIGLKIEDAESFVEFSQLLQDYPNIKNFSLLSTCIAGKGEYSPNGGVILGEDSIELCNALLKLENLERLTLTLSIYQNLNINCGTVIGEILEKRKLKLFSLKNVGIYNPSSIIGSKEEFFNPIFAALDYNKENICSFEIDSHILRDLSLAHCEVLENLPALSVLRVTAAEEAGESIMRMIKSNKLKILDMNDWYMSWEKELIEALRENTSLVELGLGYLSGNVTGELAKVVTELPNLEVLSMRSMKQGLKMFSFEKQGLKEFKLDCLNKEDEKFLSSCNKTDIELIACMIKRNKIKSITLDACGLYGDNFFRETIAKGLESNTSLREWNIPFHTGNAANYIGFIACCTSNSSASVNFSLPSMMNFEQLEAPLNSIKISDRRVNNSISYISAWPGNAIPEQLSNVIDLGRIEANKRYKKYAILKRYLNLVRSEKDIEHDGNAYDEVNSLNLSNIPSLVYPLICSFLLEDYTKYFFSNGSYALENELDKDRKSLESGKKIEKYKPRLKLLG